MANTNSPPCGAISVHRKAAESAPATAAPMKVQGITCPGSAAAKGMAPSVMKPQPITMLDTVEFLSAFVNFFGKKMQARAMPRGGTMPPTITAAMEM